ncbi:MAG: DNA alkylation repair protein [candidate division KSB1 bacterium]|nr:DNA alkylation repair protein [candidate division KSB1 bacterium]
MKGVIPFRGVGIPKNRELLIEWHKSHGIDQWPLEEQLELALTFFKQPVAEDKLAGILFIQLFLYHKLPWQKALPRYEALFQNEWIFDWNICNWFCVRVLGPTIRKHGEAWARAIAAWKEAHNLWQARSSVVPFVVLTSQSKYYPYIHDACAALIQREERFAKTAVGWILRDISKHDAHFCDCIH